MGVRSLVMGSLGPLLLLVASAATAQVMFNPSPEELDEATRELLEPGAVVLSTPRLDIAGEDLGPELAHRVAALAEEAVTSLPSSIVDPELRIRVSIAPAGEGRCPTRGFGVGMPGRGYVTLYLIPTWPDSTLRRILAHEVGHVYHHAKLAATRTSRGRAGDQILAEGLATWLARDAWLADLGFASFEAAVASYLERGTYVSITEAYEVDLATVVASPAECFALRDQLYTQWGGFVEHLVGNYGVDAVLDATNQGREVHVQDDGMRLLAPLDYQAAFGVSLGELERRWLGGLNSP